MRIKLLAGTFVLFLTTSCASAPAAVPPVVPAAPGPGSTPVAPVPPAVDTARIHALVVATAPSDPVQITFSWSLQDREFKFQGKGVVRMQGPYRARLDLFGPQDIQVLRASLIDDKLDFVYAGPAVPLPPVTFLWGVLGVFRVPEPTPPATLTADGAGFAFTYDAGASHWRFRADSATLKGAEWLGDDGGRRTVELTGPFRLARPSKAVFRDWREFRELVVTVTAVEKVDAFAPDIWDVSNR